MSVELPFIRTVSPYKLHFRNPFVPKPHTTAPPPPFHLRASSPLTWCWIYADRGVCSSKKPLAYISLNIASIKFETHTASCARRLHVIFHPIHSSSSSTLKAIGFWFRFANISPAPYLWDTPRNFIRRHHYYMCEFIGIVITHYFEFKSWWLRGNMAFNRYRDFGIYSKIQTNIFFYFDLIGKF